jgi:hypothetical protein
MSSTLLTGTEDGLFAVDLDGYQQRLPGRVVSNLIPAGDGGWLAILDRRFVARSADAGEWNEIVELADVEIASIAIHDDLLWIGTFPPHVYRWDGERLARSEAFEALEGRDSWFTPWGGPPETRSLATMPEGTVFANVHVGGIPRSKDNGASWQPTIDVRADVHQVLVHPDEPEIILAACARGLGISRDGGDSWDMRRDGVHGHYMSAVAVSGMTAFVTSSTGSSSNARSAIYRYPIDSSSEFEKTSDGLPEWFTGNLNTFCLAATDDRVAFGTRDGEVYAADANALRWDRVASGLPPVLCVQHQEAPIR